MDFGEEMGSLIEDEAVEPKLHFHSVESEVCCSKNELLEPLVDTAFGTGVSLVRPRS